MPFSSNRVELLYSLVNSIIIKLTYFSPSGVHPFSLELLVFNAILQSNGNSFSLLLVSMSFQAGTSPSEPARKDLNLNLKQDRVKKSRRKNKITKAKASLPPW